MKLTAIEYLWTYLLKSKSVFSGIARDKCSDVMTGSSEWREYVRAFVWRRSKALGPQLIKEQQKILYGTMEDKEVLTDVWCTWLIHSLNMRAQCILPA